MATQDSGSFINFLLSEIYWTGTRNKRKGKRNPVQFSDNKKKLICDPE